MARPRRGSSKPRPPDYEAAAKLRSALRRFHARTDEVAQANGLTLVRYELLLMIKTGGDQATVGRIAEQMSISQSAATQLVRRAEDAGLLERSISRVDARIRPLNLTVEGERRLRETATIMAEERALLAQALEPVVPKLLRRGRR